MSQTTRQNDPDAKRLQIRKYPNRRYYDSTRSRHLTLEEIYAAIREGYEIEVLDSKTGDDITARVLAQMIIELDPPKLGIFPVPLLHRLLRANEQLVTDFTQKYFNQALEAFLDSQRKFEQSLRTTLGLKSATPSAADWAKVMWGPLHPTMWGGGENEPTVSEKPAKADSASELDQLRREVDDLKKKLRAKASGTKPRAGKKRK
jgi:polyhydroxyalkanoate synthesis repressor PhaR